MSNNNIYNYKTPKTGNEETGYFNIKGRINRKAFFLRMLLSTSVFVLFTSMYVNDMFGDYGSRSHIFFETIYLFILPVLIVVFNLIQGAKRMHDVNQSGWNYFVPFYNLYLVFLPGTRGNNDYGIDPSPVKNIQYFDEIENQDNGTKESPAGTENKSGLDKWREHVSQVRVKYPNKTYQEILEIARTTYKSGTGTPATKQSTNPPRKQSKKGSVILNILYAVAMAVGIAIILYYFIVYKPKYDDNDHDGFVNYLDECPYESGVYPSGCPDRSADTFETKAPVDSYKRDNAAAAKPKVVEVQKRFISIMNECGVADMASDWTSSVTIDGYSYEWGDRVELDFGSHNIVEVITSTSDGSQYSDETSIEVGSNTNNYEGFTVALHCACPYFYYKEGEVLTYGGELIRNLNSPKKEKLDFSNLNLAYLQKDTVVFVIKEEKPEVSYLDNVYLTINDTIQLVPFTASVKGLKEIAASDKDYLLMNQGDSIEIYFVMPKNTSIMKAQIFSYGYYIAK